MAQGTVKKYDPAEFLEKAISPHNPKLQRLRSSFWFSEFRGHQVEAIKAVLEAFDSGMRCVVLEAPTGAGKSLIAETVRLLLPREDEPKKRNDVYVVTTKSLQGQVANDFPYYEIMMGRENYATKLNELRTAADCLMPHRECTYCPHETRLVDGKKKHFAYDCPYLNAKARAADPNQTPVAVLNIAYFMTEASHVGQFADRPFVILDEADTLEAQIMSQVQFTIPKRWVKEFGWRPPERVTLPESWQSWIVKHRQDVQRAAGRLERIRPEDRTIEEERAYNELLDLYERLESVRNSIGRSQPWAYTGDDRKARFPRIEWKPVEVRDFGHRHFWKFGDRFLAMSATIVSPEELLRSTGYFYHPNQCTCRTCREKQAPTYEVVHVPSTFSVENRLIHVVPLANMSRATLATQVGHLLAGVEKILLAFPRQRVLIHTWSYELTGIVYHHLSAVSSRPVFTYTRASERDDALADYLQTEGGVLVAPSMDRGYDFPDDAARVLVVAKVPYLSLGDRQVSERLRLEGGQEWYTLAAARTLVQMTGRAVRSEHDWAVNFILDRQFLENIYPKARHQFPKWWKDALRIESSDYLDHL